MKLHTYRTAVLALAGLTTLSIGLFIAFDPEGFYAGYAIPLQGNIDMLSELRASGANLGLLGAVMLLGTVLAPLRHYAVAAGLVVFTAFPAGRFLSLIADGWPSQKVLIALLVELVIAALCFAAFVRTRRSDP